MTQGFRTRIRRSIADLNLQSALDANAERRRLGRLNAFASLPDRLERRKRAHAIKEGVIAHLDEVLEQFAARARSNGMLVHRAQDADQALKIVLEICAVIGRDRGSPLLVAKSKSMLSEEIDLNHALEAAGMRVVETDLGEYIVQLRGERPSHIITPAVHLRRGDVGKLFEEKLGLPYTEDIPTLTATARRLLRDVFLEAEVGLSGVNFGVAETGTLCLVTNEGNGRMVTTVPRVHIALMGIERLVPSLDDLALFLSLLARSATGQKLSVYTSLIHAPLPGQTRHLILLDNGRSALRESPLAESLACIRCGACLNACPVFRELGGHAYGSIYPGPIGAVISNALVDPQFDYLAQASSLCGACREACPVDIDLPGLLLRVRAGETPQPSAGQRREGRGVPAAVRLGLRGFRLAAGRGGLFAALQTLGGLLSRLISPRRSHLRLPAWTGWGSSKDFPRLAVRPFRGQWKRIEQNVGETRHGRAPGTSQADPAAPERDRSAVERFTQELGALGGQVVHASAVELPEKLTAFLRSRGAERVLVDEAGAGCVRDISLVREADPGVRFGVTGALCGVAETGSLLLTGGAGQALAASLLPEVHVAVLNASRVLPSLPEALACPEVRAAAAAVVITGPSRTADIEMTLTIGVHGPGELHVFLIDDL